MSPNPGTVYQDPRTGQLYVCGNDGQWHAVTAQQLQQLRAGQPHPVTQGAHAPQAYPAQPYLGQVAAPQGIEASLSPPSLRQWATEGVQFRAQPVNIARVLLPQDERIAVVPRVRPIQDVLNQGVGVPRTEPIRIDIPFTAYAFVGWATPSDGTALPDNLHPLATFLISIQDSGSNLFTTEPTLARSVLGTAERPAQIGGYGYTFDRGTTLQITVTPLRANLRISVAAWGVDFMGPANFSAGGTR